MNWYAVYTQPSRENLAAENLIRQGFEVYWPRYLRKVRHARRLQERISSLFPRYLFVSFERTAPSWRSIRSTRGVIDLVRNGLDPVPVSNDLIVGIRAREDESGCVLVGRQISLKKGQSFRLRDPAFAGQELIFDCQKDNDRVVALLSMMGREFSVEVPVSQVLPSS